ncbi:MAG: hotdog fold thioesterase [Xanthomonadales bacterium]|jgi:1,4-dihydroxy-2-naphthoyl-CoA hydrolase|nr:hotdog fold thioesterase [Xanthomonadales bacterium]
MAIWQKAHELASLASMGEGTIDAHLGLTITEIGEDFLAGELPVDQRTKQPFGLLHGGANVVLAETLGSLGGWLAAPPGFRCVGLEVNANHLASARDGVVRGVARPIHLGQRTQVWGIEIRRADGQLSCISRLTLAVIPER